VVWKYPVQAGCEIFSNFDVTDWQVGLYLVGRHTTEGCYLVLSLSSEFSKAEFCSGDGAVTSLLDLEVENKLADLETERTVTYQVRPLEIRFQFILALHCILLIHFQIRAFSIPT
jgi:hypothetical protein